MSYKLEGKDIVISGFEDGIADSPYKGISDMRNADIISVPGEASVAFKTSLSTTQTAISAATFTANAGTDTFTWAGGSTLANNTAITVSNSGGALPTGLATNTAYYITNTTATTFQLSVDGGGASCATGGSILNVTDAGSGTNTFSTINMAQPKVLTSQYYNNTTAASNGYLYFALDGNGRAWYYSGATQWVYMNNLNGENTANNPESGNGMVAWKNTLFNFRLQNVGYILTNVIATGVPQTLAFLTTYANWNITWKGLNKPNGFSKTLSHYAIVGQTDDSVYFCNASYVGTILQVAGATFDPANAATFTFNEAALALPTNEIAQCLAILGTNLQIGGIRNIVYSWDRVSSGYQPIYIAESNVARIVTSNTTSYIFAGQRGRIYQCNGSQAALYKKMPDHLANQPNPYYTWGDALTSRNQLYFGVQATDNQGNAINQYGGVWAIDLDSSAIRLVNQMSYGSYAGIVSALVSLGGTPTSDGFGLLMGWYTSSNTTGGIDTGSSTPYTGGQTYIDTDMMPLGTFLKTFTPSQVEWKASVPLSSEILDITLLSESVSLYYRVNLTDSYTLIGTTTQGVILLGQTGAISDLYKTNFQKAQWVQLRVVLTSTSLAPSYCRLTEIRIRDWPSHDPNGRIK